MYYYRWSPETERLICHADNVVDNTTPEMGPVIIGCPYPPLRQTNSRTNG